MNTAIWVMVLVLSSGVDDFKASEDSFFRPPPVRCINSSESTCRVPIYALFSNPVSAFEGMAVITVGFIVKREGDFLLFPEKGISNYRVPEAAIKISVVDQDHVALLERSVGHAVQVTGHVRLPERPIYWLDFELSAKPFSMPLVIDD